MIKPFITICLFVLFVSCFQTENKETIRKLVLIGHRGVIMKDTNNWIFDSTRLKIREYYDFTKDSTIKLFQKKYKFLHTSTIRDINDLNKFSHLADSVLLKHHFKENYFPELPDIYDGNYYILYYKTNRNKENWIQYDPNALPPNLNLFYQFFTDSVIRQRSNAIDHISFDSLICIKAARETCKLFSLPPKPVSVDSLY
jgi:hypothetical protein